MMNHLLSLLIWGPMGLGVVVLAFSFSPVVSKILAVIFSVLILALCVPLYTHFDAGSAVLQFSEMHIWIRALDIHYSLGVDGISVLFMLLNCFTNLIIVLSGLKHVKENVAEYFAIFLFSTGILNGLFAAQDAFLFYVFWEASMIPVLLGIGIWGGARRAHAVSKFLLMNMLGSLMFLVALIYLYILSGSFDLTTWQTLGLPIHVQDLLFLAFFAAFAVKMPMWPLHTWFADLHAEAPLGGAIALATLMLKTGAYGFLRFSLPITPQVHVGLVWLLMILALIALVCMGFAAVVQKDMKRLIAYASISHMGIVTLGIFAVILAVTHAYPSNFPNHADAVLSLQGAVFQMITHAFASGGLFILVAILAARFGSSLIQDYQGLAKTMPVLAFFFVIFALANVGLPGTTGFVGELLVILGALQINFWVAVIAASTLVVSPAYMLWLVKRIIFGEVKSSPTGIAGKLTAVEWLMMVLLAVPVILFGFFPYPILHLSFAANTHLVDVVTRGLA